MNRYFIKKAVGAGCFVCIILGGFIGNIRTLKIKINWKQDLRSNISNAESEVNNQVIGKYGFIDLFGVVQKLLGKQEMNDFEVVRDQQGFLHYTYFANGPKDTKKLIEELVAFRNGIENEKTKFVYIMSPDKCIPGYTTFAKGLPYSYANEMADQFLMQAKQKKITTIDFRKKIKSSGIGYDKLFYKTDHHWKIETAFWAFQCLLGELQRMYQFPVENYTEVIDINNYNQITYKNSFIGSMGRKSGVYYSGVDDFTLIYPKFVTDYAYYARTRTDKIETFGTFDQALLCMLPFHTQSSKYDAMQDKYSSYLYGNQGIAHIQNKRVKGAKVLIVKDSFMLPVASFLSTVCSDVYLVDIRYYEKNVLEYVNSIKDLDYIFVSYNPQDLSEEFFKFK